MPHQILPRKNKLGSGWLVGETDCRTLVETNCVVMVELGRNRHRNGVVEMATLPTNMNH